MLSGATDVGTKFLNKGKLPSSGGNANEYVSNGAKAEPNKSPVSNLKSFVLVQSPNNCEKESISKGNIIAIATGRLGGPFAFLLRKAITSK